MQIKLKAHVVRISAGFALTSNTEEMHRKLRLNASIFRQELFAERKRVGLFRRSVPVYTAEEIEKMVDEHLNSWMEDGTTQAIERLKEIIAACEYVGDLGMVYLNNEEFELLRENLPPHP